MRICLLGDTGEGKTISAIYILSDYFSKGYKVYSNIKLTGIFKGKYTLIKNTGFTEEINPHEKNIVLLDEVGRTTYEGRTHNAIRLGDLITQSRKSIGEYSHLLFTTQLESQLNDVLKGLSDFLIYCQIAVRHGDLYGYGNEKASLPVIIKWLLKVKQRDKEGLTYFEVIDNPYYLEKDFEKVSGYYNTFEEVERFGDGAYLKLKKKYKAYTGTQRSLQNLKTVLHFKENLNLAESDRIARAIILDLEDG